MSKEKGGATASLAARTTFFRNENQGNAVAGTGKTVCPYRFNGMPISFQPHALTVLTVSTHRSHFPKA